MTETPSDPPAMPASTPRRWDWRPKVRWFGAEYLIVVLGVLTAVGINAWWQGRQAEAKETVYLRQLVADLSTTERIMARNNARMAATTENSIRQLYLSFGTQPRPPRDSVEHWLDTVGFIASPRPVLSTAEALVASGDFGAVRDDSLRSAILRYLDGSRQSLALQELYQGRARDGVDKLQRFGLSGAYVHDSQRDLRAQDIQALFAYPRPDTSGRAASPDWDYPFPYDAMEIYESQEFLETLYSQTRLVATLQNARIGFAENAAELREQVTRVIGE